MKTVYHCFSCSEDFTNIETARNIPSLPVMKLKRSNGPVKMVNHFWYKVAYSFLHPEP